MDIDTLLWVPHVFRRGEVQFRDARQIRHPVACATREIRIVILSHDSTTINTPRRRPPFRLLNAERICHSIQVVETNRVGGTGGGQRFKAFLAELGREPDRVDDVLRFIGTDMANRFG